jgi:hypothetical protein
MKKWPLAAVCLFAVGSLAVWFSMRSDPPAEITVKLLPAPNPTSYVFDRTIDQVDTALANYRDDSLGPLYMADNPVLPDEVAVFSNPANQHDAYLDSGDANGTTSAVYFSPNGQPFPYGKGMHIHVTKIDAGKTKVEVFIHKPWLYIGERTRYVFPLGTHQRSIFIKVQPTTVEEYSLLRKLGAALNVTDMPPLILPTENSGTKVFRYTPGDVINLPNDRKPLDWAVPSTLTLP